MNRDQSTRPWLRQSAQWRQVLRDVERVFGIGVDALLSRSHTQMVSIPRSACYWLLREVHGWSYPDIGVAFGRDHTTVMSGIKRLTGCAERDPVLRERIELLKPAAPLGLASTATRVRVAEELAS